MSSEGRTFNALPQPSSTHPLSGYNPRDRFSLTVAGPRRYRTGLPCYALTGTRVTLHISNDGVYTRHEGVVKIVRPDGPIVLESNLPDVVDSKASPLYCLISTFE